MVGFKGLPGNFGIEITDIDLGTAGDAEIKEMLHLFYRHQLAVVKRQDLSFERFDEITKKFGNQHPHFLDHLRMRGHPAILMLSNVYENGRQLGVHEGACFWHTDVAYQDPPNSTTMVYCIQQPRDGCPTHLADCFSAYDALSEGMKNRIDDLVCIHHYGNRDYRDDDSGPNTRYEAERMTDSQKRKVKNVYHPLVMRHPITGRKSLYSVAGTSWGIVDMPDDEALGLLRELTEHSLQEQYLTQIDYEPGDFAVWDTFSTLHHATPLEAVEPDDPNARILWRVSVNGLSPLMSEEQIVEPKALRA